MKDKFQVVAGSVTGIQHWLCGKNNQDAYHWISDEKVITAAVCDGCSSSFHSEVGAKLIARYVSEKAAWLIRQGKGVKGSEILKILEVFIIKFLRTLTEKFQNQDSAIDEMFLATIIGAMITPVWTTVFSFGDGVFGVNGQINAIDQNNTPSYIGYKIKPGLYFVDFAEMEFHVQIEMPTENVKTLMIASDGAFELQEKAENVISIFGQEEKIGGLDQFETDERYTKNPTLLQKRLLQLNTEKTHVDWEKEEIRKCPVIFKDDATIELIKRR